MEKAGNSPGSYAPGARLFSSERPLSYWDVVGRHLPLLLLSGLPLFAAHLVPLSSVPMLPCLFRELAGIPCPFCGYTRSLWAMANGDWHFALVNAPLACVLYPVLVLIFAWNGAAVLLGRLLERGRLLRVPERLAGDLTALAAFLILAQWAYRLSYSLT